LDKGLEDSDNSSMLKNPIRRYSVFMGIELLVVLIVMGVFKVVADLALGGLIAGAVFLLSTLVIVILEWKIRQAWTMALIGGLIFFFGGVLPILALRLLSWGEPFKTAHMGPITGDFLHRSSNFLYLIFLVGIFMSLQRARWEASRSQVETTKGP
jgi:hypothetical protein